MGNVSKSDMIDIIEEVAKLDMDKECKNKEKRVKLIKKARKLMDDMELKY